MKQNLENLNSHFKQYGSGIKSSISENSEESQENT